ncbi:MAG: helix-turn-helix transcriptional regulator [Bacteroidales bacterium]|nr:helix-turn-helix transcriptional regulator [Bacteroidales bacterium]MDD3521666.1 helix-turn-helix transcriptional regulator [Bacteroidales bacterium]MDD4030153.1 helix-turn-helix transcriptional regulator [Bacteroidales bacterium]MDD4435210.1 helix-turn-helix transcriptional regulator [Bacteroidales bacterium]MDD5732580.1 helix-turn-helix transcriptional regulator [Bacteroidales bacterium]
MRTRLQQFLTAENISPSRLADQIGVQRSGLSHILAGRNKPGFDFIEKMLIAYPSLNAEWLITGKGRMYKDMQERIQETIHENTLENSCDLFSEEPSISDNIDSPEDAYSELPKVKHKLVKVLLFYSDNTFTEYIPDKLT